MDKRQRGLDPLVLEVEIVVGQLRREQHALVNDGPAGERGDVEIVEAGRVLGGGLVFDPLADDEELALEGVARLRIVAPTDENLAHDRLRGGDRGAQDFARDRHRPPPGDPLAFLGRDTLDQRLIDGARLFGARQEDGARRIVRLVRQLDAGLRRDGAEEPVGLLQQYAGAVPGQRVRADRAPVVQVQQDLEALLDDAVGLAVLYIDDEADAAAVMLVAGVVESLLGWQRRHDMSPPQVSLAKSRSLSSRMGAAQRKADIEHCRAG